VLSQGDAYVILQPILEKMCEAKVVQGEVYCPFTATGLCRIERHLGKTVYQPVAHACGLLMHPSCTQRCSAAKVPCHRAPFKLFKSFAAHVDASRSTAVEDDDEDDNNAGHLHALLHRAIAHLVSPGALDGAERVAWQRADALRRADDQASNRRDTPRIASGESGLCQHMCPRTRVPELLR